MKGKFDPIENGYQENLEVISGSLQKDLHELLNVLSEGLNQREADSVRIKNKLIGPVSDEKNIDIRYKICGWKRMLYVLHHKSAFM